jgi:hypothetical protein
MRLGPARHEALMKAGLLSPLAMMSEETEASAWEASPQQNAGRLGARAQGIRTRPETPKPGLEHPDWLLTPRAVPQRLPAGPDATSRRCIPTFEWTGVAE